MTGPSGTSGEGRPSRAPHRQGSRLARELPCIRVDDGRFDEGIHEVVEEAPLALFVNGRHLMTAMVSPVDLEDFVTGYLFTEQVIRSAGEIESIRTEKNRTSIITTNLFRAIGPKKTILSGCGGSTSYIDAEKLPKIHSDFSISTAAIADLMKNTLASDLHRATGGVHIVALADREKVIAVSEDIGRHNALDRVIGHGIRSGIDFSRTFVLSSGRVSSEMVRKCLVANVPLIVSRGATTTLAVEIARKTGLTIVGFARGSRMNIYTHPERVEGAGKPGDPSDPQ